MLVLLVVLLLLALLVDFGSPHIANSRELVRVVLVILLVVVLLRLLGVV